MFHDKKHPKDMGVNEIREYLTHLAVKEISLLFLCSALLRINLPNIEGVVRAKRSEHFLGGEIENDEGQNHFRLHHGPKSRFVEIDR